MDSTTEDVRIVMKSDTTVRPAVNGKCPQMHSPPDGGARAWCVVIASFLCNGLIFGVINSYSVIYMDLQKKLESQNVEDASTKASLVGSLTIGLTFCTSPIAGILVDRFGLQRITFIGGVMASSGMLASSFLTDNVEALYLTYGVLFGVGASLAYTPSLVILGHYYKRLLGLVNGFVTAGSSCFTIAMPFALDAIIKAKGLDCCLQFLALLMTILIACAFIFKPLQLSAVPLPDNKQRHNHTFRSKLKTIINVDIWKRKRYVIWALAVPSALFGYFVPYVHMGKFVETNFTDSDGKIPVLCIAVTSGLGRLISGKLSDIPKIDGILLQQISFISIGILTMLMTSTSSFWLLVIITLGMGLFDGCFITLLGPIAFELCGQKGAAQAIGFLLGLCSIPMTVGPPVAGFIFDKTESYTVPFLLAGIPPIVGAVIMSLIRCTKDDVDPTDPSAEPLNSANHKTDVELTEKIILSNGTTKSPPPSYNEATKEKQNGVVHHEADDENITLANHTT